MRLRPRLNSLALVVVTALAGAASAAAIDASAAADDTVAPSPAAAQAPQGGAARTRSAVADAAMKGDRDAVRTLLQQGADVNAPQGDGMSALHWAADRGDAEMTAMLLY